MKEIRKVTTDALLLIIETREPLGLFYALANGVYTGVDNSKGDAWTEDFPDLRHCKRWLSNPYISAENAGTLENLLQKVESGEITAFEISEELTYRDNSSGQRWSDLLYGYSTAGLEQAEGLFARIAEIRRELDALLKAANENGKPASENFEALYSSFHGHNYDGELFDFNYKEICSTIHFDGDSLPLRLSDSCEIYGDPNDCMIADNYDWRGVNEAGGDGA